MKYNIDSEIANKHGLSMSDVAVLMLARQEGIYEDTTTSLETAGLIFKDHGRYYCTYKGKKMLKDILLSSENIDSSRELDRLSRKMINLFPQTTKSGTGLFYRCGVKECSMQLRVFFKVFSDNYTHDDILEATTRYTDYYNKLGDRTLQRTLFNFIIKEDGERTFSDLSTWIENKDSSIAFSKTYEDIVSV